MVGKADFAKLRCDKCIEATHKAFEEAERVMRAHKLNQKKEAAFTAICPELYQETDPSLLNPKVREAALNWQYDRKGLGLVGVSGIGKTRAAYLLLKRMCELGYKAQAVNVTFFAKLCVDQFSDQKDVKLSANKLLKSLYEADVVLLDDLGKQKMTERYETEFYTLLEHRVSNKLPIIWTANSRSTSIKAMFNEDSREPIMRRLIQFSTIVAVWEDDVRALKK